MSNSPGVSPYLKNPARFPVPPVIELPIAIIAGPDTEDATSTKVSILLSI